MRFARAAMPYVLLLSCLWQLMGSVRELRLYDTVVSRATVMFITMSRERMMDIELSF